MSKTQDNLRYILFTKSQTLYVTEFSWNIWNWHLYIPKVWHFALRDVFIYKKPDTSKKQDNLRYVFMYKKPETLRYAIFMELLKLAEGRGHFYEQKTMHFVLNFYVQEAMHFPLGFLYTKSETLCVTFPYARNNAICVTFLYILCIQ